MTEENQEPHACTECGEWVYSKRVALGYTTCRACGEASARRARASWTIGAPHKQGYMLITNRAELIGLNNKTVR